MPPLPGSTVSEETHHRVARSYVRLSTRYVALAITMLIGGMVLLHLLALSYGEAHQISSGFPTPYTGARLWLSGVRGANLQSWDWFRQRSADLGFTSTDVFWGNPPSLSLLFVPLAWLPPAQARIAWTIVSLLAWFAGAEWLRRAVFPASDRPTALLAGVSLAVFASLYDPFHENLHLGQIYSFLFLLECGACVLWLKGRPFGAGIFAGAALALKGYGLQLIALAALRRDGRMVRGAAASFTVMAALAGMRLGMHSWTDFLATHLRDRPFSATAVPALQTLKSFAGIAMLPVYHPGGVPPVLGTTADTILSVIGFAIQLTLLVWLTRKRNVKGFVQLAEPGSYPPSTFALAGCIALGLIFSPRAENHAYCLALACLILTLPAWNRINIVSGGILAAGILLAWPFHFQARSVMDVSDLLTAYPRLWGAVLVLACALLAERAIHSGSEQRKVRQPNSAFRIAWIAGLSLILFYVKPWRDPVDGPLLIVSRTKGNAVSFFRLDLDEREIFSIPVSCVGPFGIALSQDRRSLYSACTDNSTLSIIDVRNRQEIRTFAAPRLPAWARERPKVREVWISNEAMGAVTIYESDNAKVLAEVRTGDGPSDICFTADGATAFVTNEASGTVSWIDAMSRAKIRDIKVGKVPQGLALTPDERTLVVANYGSDAVSLVSLEEHRETGSINTGRGPVDVTVPSGGREGFAYVSCFTDGAVSVVDLKHMQEVTRLPVGNQVFGIAAHPQEDRVYVCSGGTDEVVVLRGGASLGILRRIRVPGSPTLLKLVP